MGFVDGRGWEGYTFSLIVRLSLTLFNFHHHVRPERTLNSGFCNLKQTSPNSVLKREVKRQNTILPTLWLKLSDIYHDYIGGWGMRIYHSSPNLRFYLDLLGEGDGECILFYLYDTIFKFLTFSYRFVVKSKLSRIPQAAASKNNFFCYIALWKKCPPPTTPPPSARMCTGAHTHTSWHHSLLSTV